MQRRGFFRRLLGLFAVGAAAPVVAAEPKREFGPQDWELILFVDLPEDGTEERRAYELERFCKLVGVWVEWGWHVVGHRRMHLPDVAAERITFTLRKAWTRLPSMARRPLS